VAAPERTAPGFSEAEIRAVFAGLMLAMLLAALDQNIVAVALPRIGVDLRGLGLLAWVVSAYLIASAVATPVFGKLGDLVGRRAALSAAIAFFLAGAVTCALAPNMFALIAGRAVQGIGGGAVIAVAQAAIADVVSPRERGRYQIYFSSVHVVASMAGPLIGGILTQYLSWHWIFWLNLPLGLLALTISRKTLARLAPPASVTRIDYAGALLLTVGLVALLVAVTRVGMGVSVLALSQCWLYAAAAVLLAAFVWQECHAAEPLVPLSLFAIPTVRLSCFILFVGYMQLVALAVLIPMRMQMVHGVPAGQAALRLVPLTLAGPVGAYLAGRIMQRTGATRLLQVWGAGIVAGGLLALGFAGSLHAGMELVVLALVGTGIGLQFPTSLVAIQNAVPSRHVGVATATAAFSRSLGAAIGIAVLGAMLVSLLGNGAGNGIHALRELIAASRPAPELLARATGAFGTIFRASAVVAGLSLFATLCLPNVPLRDR
jgi:EmrB/QacA subfamily drug resistance transporter